MSNRYGTRDTCLFLEFNNLVGSDCMFYPDGRLGDFRTEQEIIKRVRELRKNRPTLELKGFQRAGDRSNRVYSFPNWVLLEANR